jgi:hypothetical protein
MRVQKNSLLIIATLISCVALSTKYFAQQPVITGTIVDAQTSALVGGATVNFHVRSHKNAAGAVIPSFDAQIVTDEVGMFVISPPDSTQGVLTVVASGFATAKRAWPSKKYSERIELEPPASITGRLFDAESGASLNGKVIIIVEHPLNVVQINAEARNGTFRVSGVLSGRTFILAKDRGMAPQFLERDMRAGEVVQNLDFGLIKAAALFGRITDSQGAALSGVDLKVEYASGSSIERQMLANSVGGKTRTDKEGRYTIESIVPERPVVVHASLLTRNSNPVQYTFQANERKEATIVVPD